MERIAKRLIPPAVIAAIFCPPVGLGAVISLWIAIRRLGRGQTESALRTLDLARAWIRATLYITLAALVIASVIIYLMGPRIITAMGSFY